MRWADFDFATRAWSVDLQGGALQQAQWYGYDYYYNDFAGYEEVIHLPKPSGPTWGRILLFGLH
jgi:hypothetical protein